MRKSRTLKSRILNAVVFSVACTVPGGAVIAVMENSAPEIPSAIAETPNAGQDWPEVATLLESHDCWNDETGADVPKDMRGVIPGHVVVTVGETGPRMGGSVMVGKALAQTFDGVEHGLKIHGFCR